MKRKWDIVNENSKANCGVGNEITYTTEVLKSNLYDYNDAYVLLRCYITVTAAGATQVAFKNGAPFTKCITKTYWTTIDDAEDLDLVMPMYNLTKHISNYSVTKASLWFYSKDEATNFNADIENTDDFKSFKYKAKLLGNTEADNGNGILKKCYNWCPI